MEIYINELLDIFQSASPEAEFYCGIEDGEIYSLMDDEVDGIYNYDFAEQIRTEGDHFLPIPKLTDDFLYETMSQFVYHLKDGRPKRMLCDALDDVCAFERFTEYASGLSLEDRWNEYFTDACREYLRNCCAVEYAEITFL